MYTVDMHAWWSQASSLFTRYVVFTTRWLLRSKETRTVKLAKNHADQLLGSVKGCAHDYCVQLAD